MRNLPHSFCMQRIKQKCLFTGYGVCDSVDNRQIRETFNLGFIQLQQMLKTSQTL